MSKLSLLSLAAIFFVALNSTAWSAQTGPPNVLIIMADDCTYNDLPLYGGRNAKTPNLDQLAQSGLTFNRAFLAAAMCQPCRAELYSGRYPMSNGCTWNHSASLNDLETMPQLLGKLGYRVGIAGKVHVGPPKTFPFESVDGFDGNCVRDPTKAHEIAAAANFMTRSDDPFCLVVALVEPHVPWVMGDASAYPPNKIDLPQNIADTAETRRAFGRYLAEITYMDGQVGELLQTLELSGKSEDTLVLFTSEQGSQFPGNKWTNYNTGVHTALIARWPGVIEPGNRTDALVQYADVLPTLLDVAGSKPTEHGLDGSSFLNVLKGQTNEHRKFVYGVHNNVPEGPPYPIRSITDGQYHYIRNLTPENLYIEKHLMGINGNGKLNNLYWQTWVFESWNNEEAYRLIQRYQHRPAEELYDLQSDPHEMNNLIGSESLAVKKGELSAELDRWLIEQGDPGIDQDTHETHKAAKSGQHRYRTKAAQKPTAGR
ncbi:sulfatase family protein [Stieleria varia]|uniref:Choline-sulfatase n=1 Tax=Stieleria varia TaxID=2528005 RepID=A0A5C6AZY1_9BACT|nr:sulfatase [Stieleria varia]TWU04682.1 Choline-sulfatase [Stieleria varia]